MKRILSSLLVLLVLASISRAAETNLLAKITGKPAAGSAGTNSLSIVCDNGMEYTNGRVTYQGNVQVLDADMSLTCELLTVYFPTNFGRLDLIVAETNVFITYKDTVAVADRVVYNATNDLVTLTGGVILDTPQASVSGDVATYDLKTGYARVRVNANTSNKVVNIIGLGSGPSLMGSNAFAFPIPGAKQPAK